MPAKKVIEVRDLVKNYGDIAAVDGISFDVYRGEIFSMVGPNGAGKTTTVEILECLRRPTSGAAKVFGLDLMRNEAKIKERIGVVPQEFNTFDRLTVKENVELISNIYGAKGDMRQNLESLGLWEMRNKRFESLSGGMKQRVGIAMALASDPELFFLDEPTTGLDPQARRELWETIKDLKRRGMTVFLTTHYMEEVEALSDRATLILTGRLFATGTPRELVSKYGGETKIVVRGNGRAKTILRRFTKDVSVDEGGNIIGVFRERERVARALLPLYKLPKCKIDVAEPSMNDVFLRVAGGRIDEKGELIS
jgi:ABC-2 type transport system ATP-binding protein